MESTTIQVCANCSLCAKSVLYITTCFPGQHQVYCSYVNLLEEATSDDLVRVHCDTYNYPPTYVVWKKNGADVNVDGENYEALQTIMDRRDSHYSNTLIIRDVAGILEMPVYTCVVGNVEGNVLGSVKVDISITFSGTCMYVYIDRLSFNQQSHV